MALPDRIRLAPFARLTVLRAIRCYVKSLLESPESEKQNWPEAMDAWKLAKSLATREKGRRQRWSADWYYDFDASRPVKDIDQWITDLENYFGTPTQGLKPGDVVTAASPQLHTP